MIGIFLALWLWAAPALALDASEMLQDPTLEARARAISRELRCVVCQSESIDDSPAELAGDLRRRVRERLLAGDSDAAVIAYVRDRYGDSVLMRPPVQANTAALWMTPAAGLLAGGFFVAFFLRRRR